MFSEPNSKKPHLKVLVFGLSGSGKTAFCLTSGIGGKPTAVLDAEHGTDLMADGFVHANGKVVKPNFKVLHTQSPEDCIKAMDYIEKHSGEFSALAVDGGSVIWEMAQDSFLKKQSDGASRIALGAWNAVKLPVKRTYHRIMRLPLPVIMTCRAKEEYSGDKTTGRHIPDFEKGVDYAFDLVLQMGRDGQGYYANVFKSRMVEWKQGATITDPTWQKIIAPIAHRFDASAKQEYSDEGKVAEQLYGADPQRISRDEVLAKLDGAAAKPHLKNILAKYRDALIEANAWDEAVAYAKRIAQEKGWSTEVVS